MSRNTSIDAILFDLGGVLIEVAGAERMLEWCPALCDLDTMWRRWLESPGVRRYETGASTRQSFAADVIREFGLPITPDAFLVEFAWWPRTLHDGALELLDELRPRFRLASLSNTNELHWERFIRDWRLPDRFHANFPSYAVGRLKPDADYFEHVLATLEVPAKRALFLDDNAINVAAAAKIGLVARRAIGPQGVRAVLSELGLDERRY
ncbi:MAG TPA: HAD-IA family hydrolase [Casimicrobiaceae bacterium]|nr:HAD-IA family hydrolase [Casimicrobiaceae bacterium]